MCAKKVEPRSREMCWPKEGSKAGIPPTNKYTCYVVAKRNRFASVDVMKAWQETWCRMTSNDGFFWKKTLTLDGGSFKSATFQLCKRGGGVGSRRIMERHF